MRSIELPEAIRINIADALDEGDYLEAARIWGRLRIESPSEEWLRVEEIGALTMASAWSEAEDCASQAIKDFPHSLYIRIAQAVIAHRSYDWQVAVDRYEKIRSQFDPLEFQDSLATVLSQLHCFEHMLDFDSAAQLANAWWPFIRRTQFGFRHEVFLLGTLLHGRHRAAHTKWALRSVPTGLRKNYIARVKIAIQNSTWIERDAKAVTILSLGQNCLPWMLPNRWGLRPAATDMSPIGPFDYFPTVGDKAAEALNSNFQPFLDDDALKTFTTATKIPALMNERMQASFFHETGNWWAANDWCKLKESYNRRISNFRKHIRNGNILYIYCVCGPTCVESIVDSYHKMLDDKQSRLLIINVQKVPLSLEPSTKRVSLINAPYPEDYSWTQWEEFTSDRGLAFELGVVNAIKTTISQLLSDDLPKASLPFFQFRLPRRL